MANVKRSSTNENPTTSKTTKKNSKKSTKDTPQDGRVPIFVRISQKAKSILDKAAELPIQSMTNARIIEALLEHLDGLQDPKKQADILMGTYGDPIKKFEDWQATLLLAQHAYDNGRFILAEQLYKTLSEDTNRSEKFISLCNYKLGLCWMGISNELRNEALTKKTEAKDYERFDLALRTLNEAIDYTRKVEGNLGGLFNLIMHYNRACCYSMKAQYMVEARIDLNDAQITEMCKASNDFTAAKRVWEDIGKTWRGEDKRRDIDFEAEKALDELKEIFPLTSSENFLAPVDPDNNLDLLSDRNWLVGAALKDKDLIFLHTDKNWQPEFQKWSESALRGDRSIVDTVWTLLGKK